MVRGRRGRSRSWPVVAAVLALFGGCAGSPSVAAGIDAPLHLRCEYVVEPLGVDTPRPRLSWVVGDRRRGAVQAAFQVLAATDPERLQPGTADVWDSGKVASDRTVHVEWGGPALGPAARVYWTVRTWSGGDLASAFAAPTWFETGLLDSAWSASWIGDGLPEPAREQDFYGDRPAPLLRRSFRLEGPVARARLYVTGLGWHVVWLNGVRLGDRRLEPAWTAFDEVVPYTVHDVTDQLRDGENVLGAMLGNGWYAPLPLRMWGKRNLRDELPIGRPKLIARLDVQYSDGRRVQIGSDELWRTAPGPVRRNNVYLGEWQDARTDPTGWREPGFDAAGWRTAAVVAPPGGTLRWLSLPPVRHTRTLRPRSIRTLEPGLHVVDFGQNFAGVVRLRMSAPRGTEVVLRFAEELHDDGGIDVDSTVAAQIKEPGLGGPGAPDVAWQEDRYVCRGDGVEVFEPVFTSHGCRYVEIRGLPQTPLVRDVEGLVLHTDLTPVSTFACSNVLLDRVQQVVDWTLRSNAQGILADCPARERFGYGGDMVASADAYITNFDMATMHAKATGDFARAARPHGGMSECAPDIGVNESGLTDDTGPLSWMFAHALLLDRVYRHYGDRRLVEQQYVPLCNLVRFCHAHIPGHVTVADFGDHGCIGTNPVPVVATATWFRLLQIAADFAIVLGREDDAREFLGLANAVRAEVAKVVDPTTGVVVVRNQSALATTLATGLVPARLREAAFATLLAEIAAADGRVTTGMFGTGMLLDCLDAADRSDVAYQLLSTREYPGYGYQIDHGATTLWEHWSRQRHWSRNHTMYAAVAAWLQRTVLGIRQAADSVAWKRLVIAPAVVGDLQWAQGHHDTVRGRVACAWQRQGSRLLLDVVIPANTRAVVQVPMLGSAERDVLESGEPIVVHGEPTNADPMLVVHAVDAHRCEVHVGAGSYHFEVR